MSILVLTSCDKEGYEPISTSTDACQIIVNCLDHNGKSLLDNNKFVNGISIEGDASHSKIKYDVKMQMEERFCLSLLNFLIRTI